MVVAALFNSDHPSLDGNYGIPVRNAIIRTGILQECRRHLRVRAGDVLTHFYASGEDLRRLCEAVYLTRRWKLLHGTRLTKTFGAAVVYAWMIENLDEKTALQLHNALRNCAFYLGLHGVDLRSSIHRVLYRDSLPAKYRIEGKSCRIFYSLGQEEEVDKYEQADLLELGFTDVEFEDRGAHDTFFDPFNNAAHYECIEDFRAVVQSYCLDKSDVADELVILIDDLNPRLFRSLAACASALRRAKNEEELAQSALSLRRYIEQLANELFPARREQFNGRLVTTNKVKNRLWAFIQSTLKDKNGPERLDSVGRRIDALVDGVNSLVHGAADRQEAERLFVEMTNVTQELLRLDPNVVRRPYTPFDINLGSSF